MQSDHNCRGRCVETLGPRQRSLASSNSHFATMWEVFEDIVESWRAFIWIFTNLYEDWTEAEELYNRTMPASWLLLRLHVELWHWFLMQTRATAAFTDRQCMVLQFWGMPWTAAVIRHLMKWTCWMEVFIETRIEAMLVLFQSQRHWMTQAPTTIDDGSTDAESESPHDC
jgi:hypothetical protein